MTSTAWTDDERQILDALDRPDRVQEWLDAVPYSADPIHRCPPSVMRDRKAHCMDGAVLAAAALEHHGLPPLLVDLRAERDDDHVIAVFRRHGAWGSVAKSNVVGLRYREPVYRSLRELVMSFFDEYYNLEREKALRSWSRPVDVAALAGWRTLDPVMDTIVERLDRARHTPLLSAEMIAGLRPVDERRFHAGLMGADDAGLYKPWEHAGPPG